MSKFCYVTPVESEVGKLLTKFWSECKKAERRAAVYAKNMGAIEFFMSPEGFTGGVEWLVFENPDRVQKERWKEGKPIDGVRVFKPQVTMNVKSIADGQIRTEFDSPYKDAINVVYKAGKPTDKPRYKKDSKKANKYSKAFLAAVHAEKQRLALPVISVDSLMSILKLKIVRSPQDNSGSTPDTMPTFFLYNGEYVISCDYPSVSSEMTLISSGRHLALMNAAINAQRKLEKYQKESATN